MKRLIPIIVLVAACAGAQDPGAQLDAKIVALQARADALEAQAHDLPQAALDTLQSQITALQAQAHDLPQTELDALQAQVDAIFARLSALEMDRDDHEARISVLEGAGPPPGPVCGNNIVETGEVCDGSALAGQTCTSQGFDSGTLSCSADCLSFDTSACVTDPPPPISGSLADGAWVSIPGSEMRSIFDPAIDQQPGWPALSFDAVQDAWNGAVCVGDELVLMGGGHGDGANNGVFAVNVDTGSWRRITMPSATWQKTDPAGANYCPDDDGDGINTCTPPLGQPCDWGWCNVMPDGAAAARHTYDSLTTDGTYLYVMGGSIWQIGNVGDQPQAWKLELETGEWTPLSERQLAITTQTAMVGGEIYATMPSWAGPVYTISSDSWASNGFLNRYVNVGSSMVYAPSVDKLFVLGHGRAWAAPRVGWPTATADDLGASGHLAMELNIGVVYYPPEDLVLSWDGGQTIETLDPITYTWGSVTPIGEDPGATTGTGTFGRFNYCGGKVVVVNGVDKPLYFVDVGEAPAPLPPPPSDETSNFAERCAAASVVMCDPLDTEGPYGINGAVMSNSDGTEGIPAHSWWRNWRGVQNSSDDGASQFKKPRLDTEVKASGTGSLKFDYPPFSGSGGGGLFATNFSDDLSVQFGEGSTFYVQFRVRYNCEFIYFDCDPASPSYRTTHRYFQTPGGGKTSSKITIISTGDWDLPEKQADACTWLETVLNHGADHYLKAYHSCGWYAGLESQTGQGFFGTTVWDFQPNGLVLGAEDDHSPSCWNVPDPNINKLIAWGHTGPDCWYIDSNEWATFQVMIAIGKWQPDRIGSKSSHITVWAAHEGQPQRVIIDKDVYLRGPEESNQKYGKIWLLPFSTGKDSTEDHPLLHAWYDELIVSTSFIEDPI